MLTAKLEKQFTERISDPEDGSTSSVCEDEFENKSNKDGNQISQKYQLYQTFYETWVKEVLYEWKKNLSQIPHAPIDIKVVR